MRAVAVFCVLAAGSSSLRGQARPTATRRFDIQAGGGYVSAQSDYAPNRYPGVFGYADLDLTKHLGGEFEVHQIYSPNYNDHVHERSYELGVRYRLNYNRFQPYAKVMLGRGVFNYPYNAANLAYNLFAGGVGVDVRAYRFLNVRAEYEFQRWLSFPPNGLTPSLFSIGVAYHFK